MLGQVYHIRAVLYGHIRAVWFVVYIYNDVRYSVGRYSRLLRYTAYYYIQYFWLCASRHGGVGHTQYEFSPEDWHEGKPVPYSSVSAL